MSQLINQPAPSFSLPVLGGGRVSLADLRGRIAIINFWSAECPWSRRADLVLLYRHNVWSRAGIKIVGISSTNNEPESELVYEVDVRHIKYPLALDVTHEVARAYKAEMTPHFLCWMRKALCVTSARSTMPLPIAASQKLYSWIARSTPCSITATPRLR